MLASVARFEVRYLLRNPLLWATAAATFLGNAALVGIDGVGMAEGGVLENAASVTLQKYVVFSLLYLFVTTAFVANAVLRDDETGFGPIIRATPISRRDYLMGRFLGAFATAALCMLLLPIAIVLGSAMPWAPSAQLGPTRITDHLYGYFLVALPNLLAHSAVFFALATVTRSMMGTYLGVIGFLSGYFILQKAFGDRPQLETVVALADPFAARPISDATRYWTAIERNVTLPDFAGVLLYNRLLWIGVALIALALAYFAYRSADRGLSRRERRRPAIAVPPREEAIAARPPAIALPSPRHGNVALRALLWLRTRFEMRQVVSSPAFVVLMAWGLFTTLVTLLTQRDPDGRPTYPTTLSMIPELEQGLAVIPLVIAIYYAGELVWRERDRRMHELIDAVPMPNWAYVVSKTAAMALVLLAVMLVPVLASVGLQLSLGYTELELGKYLLWYVLPGAWDMLLIAALAVFVQAISPHKAVGWGLMALFIVWQQASSGLIDHVLLVFGGTPPMLLSDMNGAGSFWVGAWNVRAYWGAFALLLLVAAHLLWRRGSETRLMPRLVRVRRGLAGAPGWVAGAALLALSATGACAFYNTNVLNDYRSPLAGLARMAAFEKGYAKYHDLPQPTITGIVLDIALYPEERRAVTQGRYRLRNLTPQPVPELHVRVLDEDLELTDASVAGAQLALDDPQHGYRIYRFDRPMQPGEERVFRFGTKLWPRGFRNGWPNTRLVENGTFLGELQLAPLIGFSRLGMIQDPEARRRFGLPQAPGTPTLEDPTATARTLPGRGWASADITVSTAADQTPLAPGNKVSDVTHAGRRTARFVSDAPVHPRFTILSARYAERRRSHDGMALAVYHHPAHHWNVDRMLDAMAAALDYYRANFGPYQFDHARIAEFPGYHSLAQAFAGTIPYSETVGFISDYRAPDTIDYVTYLTAHELAHQYWAHQVVGADMEGQELLSETLAQYSAQMVVKTIHGKDHLRRYLQFELDRYLEGRAYEPAQEPPLIRTTGQNYLAYRKGALAMYLLQERLGEDAVNRALASLLQRYRFQGAPYPRSTDLVDALRAQATTREQQQLITDLFERVVLYDLKVTTPTAVRRADGAWDVTVPVEASKYQVDARGTQTEVPIAERIEVGLFTAEPGRDAFDARNVILMERQPIRSGAQVLAFVTDRKPTHAGVDPYNFYIDRNPVDNVGPLLAPTEAAAD